MVSKDIYLAAQLVYNEEIIAIPTETVYGLAGNIYSEKAIQKICGKCYQPRRFKLKDTILIKTC